MESSTAQIVAVLTAFVAASAGLGIFVTKGTDFFRNLFDPGVKAPKWIWNVVPFVIALGICLGFELNTVGSLAHSVPLFADGDKFDGSIGQILSAGVIGGMASFWHEKLSQWSAASGPAKP